MKMLVQHINTFLRETDIEGLIQNGAPPDEYETEAEAIAVALLEVYEQELTDKNVQGIIAQVWAISFELSESDLQARLPHFQALANSIVLAYQQS